MCTVSNMNKSQQAGVSREARVELADNLELAVIVNEQRLCARLSPGTARPLAGVLLQLAGPVRYPRPQPRLGSELLGQGAR